MPAYYNEIDAYAAQWLRNLIAAGHIAPGDVDTRSIMEVSPDDLRGYSQCHFFAGIGGWSLALRLAGWDDTRPVWTGSCPCQPFSAAGKRKGEADERHLWPEFRRLISVCAPPVVFGEQVASAPGRRWLAGVRADLEALAYGVGAADLCAASVGAPHIRQRLWWVADSEYPERRPERGPVEDERDGKNARWKEAHSVAGACSPIRGQHGLQPQDGGPGGGVGIAAEGRRGSGWTGEAVSGGKARCSAERSSASFWSDALWLPCTDGKARRTQPGLQPLAHGVSGRVGRLRAYGNAIVPEVAAEFIRAAA